jgi:hypothetical protein
MSGFDPEVQSYDPFWDRARPELKFSYLPRKCVESKKIIWLSKAYRYRRIITGPGDPIIEDRWVSKEEAILKILRG